VATALGVGSVLEGSVRRDADRLRVSATLVDARDGLQLWSGRFDRGLRDVFAIQEEIAASVVEAVRGEVGAEDFAPLAGEDTEALLALALRSAARAVELDPTLAYGHAVLGHLRSQRADWDGSLTAIERALELNPDSVRGHVWLSGVLMNLGDVSRGLEEARLAFELDPLSPILNTYLGRSLLFAGELDEGVDRLRHALRLNPNLPTALLLYWAYLRQGRAEEAVEVLPASVPRAARPPLRAVARIFGPDALNRLYYWRAARSAGDRCLGNPYVGAGVRAHLGDREGTFECLGQAVDYGYFNYFHVDPIFEPYRDDPRFEALLARVGLAD
jgi:cytochrome c-type biogenesis protein CcmH/NrfG